MASKPVETLWTKSLIWLLEAGVSAEVLRKAAVKKAEQSLYNHFVVVNEDHEPKRCQEDKYHVLSNMLHSIGKALASGCISQPVRRAFLKIFVGNVLMGEKMRRVPFIEKFGFVPPGFVTISPAKQCNLHCVGCYAGSTTRPVNLDYGIVDRVVNETRKSWGSHFTVISGGEPLMWRSNGKGIMDLYEESSDTFFMMYTNATLIDEKMAERMAQAGKITPAISVEGLEAETDARRGSS